MYRIPLYNLPVEVFLMLSFVSMYCGTPVCHRLFVASLRNAKPFIHQINPAPVCGALIKSACAAFAHIFQATPSMGIYHRDPMQ